MLRLDENPTEGASQNIEFGFDLGDVRRDFPSSEDRADLIALARDGAASKPDFRVLT